MCTKGKKNCGSPADGALNFMTMSVVSAQIIINVINAANNNNNNRNNNNNNNNNNDQNENDNTFMITISNTNMRKRSFGSLFPYLNELIGSPRYGRQERFLNSQSQYYKTLNNISKDCVLKSICQMAEKRQNEAENPIYKTVSLYATAQLSRHLNLKTQEILEAVKSTENCDFFYSLCVLD